MTFGSSSMTSISSTVGGTPVIEIPAPSPMIRADLVSGLASTGSVPSSLWLERAGGVPSGIAAASGKPLFRNLKAPSSSYRSTVELRPTS